MLAFGPIIRLRGLHLGTRRVPPLNEGPEAIATDTGAASWEAKLPKYITIQDRSVWVLAKLFGVDMDGSSDEDMFSDMGLGVALPQAVPVVDAENLDVALPHAVFLR